MTVGFSYVVSVVNCTSLTAPVGGPAKAFTFSVSDDGGIGAASYAIAGSSFSSNLLADAGAELVATYTSGTVTFSFVTPTVVSGTLSVSGTAVDGGTATLTGAFTTPTICQQ